MRNKWFSILLMAMITLVTILPSYPETVSADTYHVGQTWEVKDGGMSYTFDLGNPGVPRNMYSIKSVFNAKTEDRGASPEWVYLYYSQDGVKWYLEDSTPLHYDRYDGVYTIPWTIFKSKHPEVSHIRYVKIETEHTLVSIKNIRLEVVDRSVAY
ncbi:MULTISPECIES: hypothetical protein [Paenibacillus]|uniref:hypothetical protein n=1 Tax=Paenibacillus TaxID=44249 RepID=UPI0003820208|nr:MULTISPECIES: hypothetical protein [Paenibacillus]MEB4783107.1 hypothetical protein [Paenibacillus jamilae]KAF6581921.1 hypothetical protein G9G57_19880 [Paenibacillus sp. EKM211P]KJD37825.1 hypothetical protein QD46_23025 [Paenibacillus polymyxa]KKD53973.1 hypothetical protein C400_16215 [Paenibacillus sp. ICGEB2008]MBE3646698.1 hypothetical protein [Paenibacillus polymyxa]